VHGFSGNGRGRSLGSHTAFWSWNEISNPSIRQNRETRFPNWLGVMFFWNELTVARFAVCARKANSSPRWFKSQTLLEYCVMSSCLCFWFTNKQFRDKCYKPRSNCSRLALTNSGKVPSLADSHHFVCSRVVTDIPAGEFWIHMVQYFGEIGSTQFVSVTKNVCLPKYESPPTPSTSIKFTFLTPLFHLVSCLLKNSGNVESYFDVRHTEISNCLFS